MPSKREIRMRKLKDLLRFKALGLSQNKVELALKVSGKTVRKYWERAEQIGLSYSEALSEAQLEQKLILDFGEKVPIHSKITCDWKQIAEEITRKKVGLNILWEEEHAAGRFHLSYSQFCRRFAAHHKRQASSFHKEYKPGELAEVDFTDGISLMDLNTREVISTHLFLMVLGASRYTYAEFCLRQDLPTWLKLHTHAFEYFGGVPGAVVPDNLKSAVAKACRYEPETNPTYTEYTLHYGYVILPARVAKPKDKPLVERGALAFQKWFYQKHRHRRFISLSELNQQLWEDLKVYNHKIHRRFGESRIERFQRLEKASLKPLPHQAFELAYWKKAKLHPDCHVSFEKNYYSAPFQYRGDYLEVRATASTIEVYHKGQRVAAHLRSYQKGEYLTSQTHLPPEHQALLEITPQRLLKEAKEVGEATETLLKNIFAKKPHPTLALRACLGILRLKSRYSPQRLEVACQRALQYRAYSYRSVHNILARGLEDLTESPLDFDFSKRRLNPYLRGKDYYH